MESARYLDQANSRDTRLQVEVKADNTLVMNLDFESQRLILGHLSSAGYPIIAEEDPTSHRLIDSEESYFLVDPLDGTTSAKRFIGQYGGQVGFGPLVGFVYQHCLSAVAFYSVPHRSLFTATKGGGAYITVFSSDLSSAPVRRRLQPLSCPRLKDAGVLFFISKLGEAKVIEYLRREHAVENIYRFGGFANDSARIAQGFEQIQLQFLAKPWDFAAVLLAAEAGSDVICDPLGRRIPLDDWRIEANNPIVVLPAGTRDDFFRIIDCMR